MAVPRCGRSSPAPGAGTQAEFVPEALQRAHAYLEAGADCVYPIGLSEPAALLHLMSEIDAPVTVIPLPQSPSLAAGRARRGARELPLYRDTTARFEDRLASLRD